VADLFARQLAHLQQPSLVAQPHIAKVGGTSSRRPTAVLAAVIVGIVILGSVLAYSRPWRSTGPAPATLVSSAGGTPSAATTASAATTVVDEPPATGVPSSHVLQERAVVRAALIDFAEPERRFGGEPQDNSLRRGEQCNAYLVRFDLEKLGVPPKARIAEATVSFYVWDPSSSGTTKVCAFPLMTAWDPDAATWLQPAEGKSWRDRAGFAFGADTGPPGPAVVVKPDQPGSDTVDPPIEHQLDVTDVVRAWLEGGTANHGLAIAPVIDPSVDQGFRTRFQIYGPYHGRTQYAPKLTVQVRQ
jgi:hypothetical protein